MAGDPASQSWVIVSRDCANTYERYQRLEQIWVYINDKNREQRPQ